MGRFFKMLAKLVTWMLLLAVGFAAAQNSSSRVMLRDIADISGVRENPLIGYGIVVGLNGTGDRQQTLFTTQTLANAMQRLGVQIAPSAVRVNNVAAVFVTASLPPFARAGIPIDVTVSSTGDAKSLEGGILLLTALRGADGQVYATAQGPLTLGGYSAVSGANTKQTNHPNVGRILNGAIVERDTSIDLRQLKTVSLMLRNPDFIAASAVATAINQAFAKPIASMIDSRRIDVEVSNSGTESVPQLISRVQELSIDLHPPARVIVNERTGTIVMGGDVKLTPVSLLHGGISVNVERDFKVSQPNSFSQGQSIVTPETKIQANEPPARSIELAEGASVQQLISGLQAIGATARDIVAILQAIKAAGGLQAQLEVL